MRLKRVSFLIAGALVAATIGTFADAGPRSVSAATFNGPLKTNATNGRYFTNNSNIAVYLSGSHTWTNLQDRGTTYLPPTFDYNGFMSTVVSSGHDFMRLWTWEQVNYVPWVTGNYYFTMNGTGSGVNANSGSPWGRSATVCCAADGGNKFDLNINSSTLFNQAYFDRLNTRVQAAYNNGVYVSVMLFNGWSIQMKSPFSGNPWPGHPFNVNNNINSINGDPVGTGQGTATHTINASDPNINAVNDLQKAYIRKVVDTVNSFDNVVYEVSNEDSWSAADTNWQNTLINYLKQYEAGKPKQHPVGMTFQDGGPDSDLFSSSADWVSPAQDYSTAGSSAATGNKVVLTDTDHIYGEGGDAAWVWGSFTRGTNPIYMDDGAALGGGTAAENSARLAMGETVTYANKMNLLADVPHGDLVSTGYGLANPGTEYLAFQPTSNTQFTVNLVAGTYAYEWLNVANNTTTTGSITAPGGNQPFTAPFSGYAVLYLKASVNPPPIGYNGAGSDTTSYSAAGQTIVYRFQAASSVTLAKMDLKIYSVSGSASVKLAIYSDSNGSPGSLLATTVERTGLTSGWQQFNLASQLAITAGTYYWLGWITDTSNLYYYADAGSNSAAWTNGTYPTFPNPYGTPAGTWTRSGCIYAEAASVNPPPIGYNGAGLDTSSYSADGQTIVYRFQAASSVTLAKMDLKIYSVAGSARVKLAIYSDSNGSPGSLLATTVERTGLTSGWQQFNLASPLAITAGTYFWLGWITDTSNLFYYADAGSNSAAWTTGTYPNFPNPYGTPAGTWTRIGCIYAET